MVNGLFKLVNRLSGIVSRPTTTTIPIIDLDGYQYGQNLEINDGVVFSDNYAAEQDLVANLKTDGLWDKVKAAFLMGYGTQASCLRDLKTIVQGTIPGGTVTALSGRVSLTSNGSIRFIANANTYVITNSHAFALDFYDTVATGAYDFGCRDGAPHFCLFRYAAGIGISAGLGYFGAIQTPGSSITGSKLYMASRTSATAGGHYLWDGTTFTAIATSNSLSGGSIPARQPIIGALNAEGTPTAHSNGRYRSCWILDGLTSAEWQLFSAHYQSFKITRGWI